MVLSVLIAVFVEAGASVQAPETCRRWHAPLGGSRAESIPREMAGSWSIYQAPVRSRATTLTEARRWTGQFLNGFALVPGEGDWLGTGWVSSEVPC